MLLNKLALSYSILEDPSTNWAISHFRLADPWKKVRKSAEGRVVWTKKSLGWLSPLVSRDYDTYMEFQVGPAQYRLSMIVYCLYWLIRKQLLLCFEKQKCADRWVSLWGDSPNGQTSPENALSVEEFARCDRPISPATSDSFAVEPVDQ